jgi:phospho-N-acetylmuramoyl-pentapeptide-transferase
MFLEFIYPLVKYFTPFNVFLYLTFRGAYAALTTLLICFVFGSRIIESLRRLKIGQSIREDGPETHLKKGGTPTMGGVFIIVSVTISMLMWMDIRSWKVWLCLGSFIAFGAIGFIDDYLKVTRHNSEGLPAWGKLAGQFAVAIAVMIILYFSGEEGITTLYIPFFKNPVVDMGWLWVPFGVLLIVGESNAVNFSDGLDGLLAGLLILVFIALAILTYLSGRADYSSYLGIPFINGAGELTVFCLAAVGSCIGFLWFNAHPAEVFMGDVGSLSLGGVVAVISLVIKKEILVLIIGGVFVLEIASVIIQVLSFKLRKKRVFKMAPLHHHF